MALSYFMTGHNFIISGPLSLPTPDELITLRATITYIKRADGKKMLLYTGKVITSLFCILLSVFFYFISSFSFQTETFVKIIAAHPYEMKYLSF